MPVLSTNSFHTKSWSNLFFRWMRINRNDYHNNFNSLKGLEKSIWVAVRFYWQIATTSCAKMVFCMIIYNHELFTHSKRSSFVCNIALVCRKMNVKTIKNWIYMRVLGCSFNDKGFNFASVGASERDIYVHPQNRHGDSFVTYITGMWTRLMFIKLF